MVNHRDSLRGTQWLKQPITVLTIFLTSARGQVLKVLTDGNRDSYGGKEKWVFLCLRKYQSVIPRTIKWENTRVQALSLPQADLLSYVCQTAILTRSNLKRC